MGSRLNVNARIVGRDGEEAEVIDGALQTSDAGGGVTRSIPAIVGLASTGTNSPSQTTSITFSHTLSSDTDCLVVLVAFFDNPVATISSVTYDGVAMTEVIQGSSPQTLEGAAIYYMIADDLPSAGAHNVVVTGSAAMELSAFAQGYKNVDQTTPFGDSMLSYDLNVLTFTPNVQLLTPNPGCMCLGVIDIFNSTAATYTAYPPTALWSKQISNGGANDSLIAAASPRSGEVTQMAIPVSAARQWTMAGAVMNGAIV